MPTETSLNLNINNRDYFESPEGQSTVTKFVDKLKTEVGNQAGYLETCKKADETGIRLDSDTLEKLFDRFSDLIENTPPGHDVNHIRRDALAGLAFASSDQFVKSDYSPSDIDAGILGSIFHDIGNAVTRRYEDIKRANGHAEIGAYIFWKTSEGILGEDLRKLTTYAIAAHTHYLKPVPVKEPQGYERQPYWYEIFYPENNKPCGLAPILTRFSDRLEVNGGTVVTRTLISYADASESGGQDFQGDQEFFEINKEKLETFFHPEVREGKPKPPTVLEHALMFAESNFGNSIYSRDDHLFPIMEELIKTKTAQTDKLIQVVKAKPDMMDFSELSAEAKAKDTIRQISGSKNFESAWNVLSQAWRELDSETQAKWKNGFEYIQRSYTEWLDLILGKVGEEYKEFANKLARECL